MNFSSHFFSYHVMRRLLLILMIALLPLRGLAGDAMATGMAAGQMAHNVIREKVT